MELRQLEYFVAVAEEESFTRAAARLYVAQPGVSAQVRRLERELGEELLDRSGRTVRLTKVGAAVLPYARAALNSVAGVRLTIDELTGLLRGSVAVGTVPSCLSFGLQAVLADFHKSYPGVEIALSEANSDSMLEDLHAGQLDVAVIGLPAKPPPGISTYVIADELIGAAASLDDPLAGQSSVALEALKNRDLISLPRGTGVRSCFDEACAAVGFHPRIAFEASDPNVLAELAIRGLGLAIIPASLGRTYEGELELIAITRPRIRGRLAIAWRENGLISPAARAFLDYAVTSLGEAATGQGPVGPEHQVSADRGLCLRRGDGERAERGQ